MKLKTQKRWSTFHVSRFTFHEKGFTIIELLVSISIIGILSVLVMVNFGFGSHQQNLSRAAQQLALDIRKAQNLSLAPSDSPNCLYGFRVVSSTQYILYRKTVCPLPRTLALNNEYDVSNSSITESTILTKNIVIATIPLTDLDVSFEPPEPITYLQGVQNNTMVQGVVGNTTMTITLRSPDGTTKDVKINRFGQVEIQ